MKPILKLICVLVVVNSMVFAQTGIDFDKYFFDRTMRIDYHHSGDAVDESITPDKIYKYGIWAGSKKNLLDRFNNGAYYIKIYDEQSNELIYSKGFDSYFKEYQTSEWAINGIRKTYHESAIIPMPKNKIKFVVEKRNNQNLLNEVFSSTINPDDVFVIDEPILDKDAAVYKALSNGDPHTKLDIVILGEGYTGGEKTKFEKDLERFKNTLIEHEPFKKFQSSINLYGVYKPSEESGIDEPESGIFKNTVLNSTFNSLGSERYVLTEDNKSLRDLAAHAPYDAIYIMVNHPRYGGGGIYNFYCTFTSDNQFHDYLFLHEFGHSFAGLADEYYTSETAYNEFYPQGTEPVEPNITRLLDGKTVKWSHLLSEGIEVPTPWEKEEYDKNDYAWQKERREMNSRIAQLKRNKSSKQEIDDAVNEYDRKDRAHSTLVDNYLKNSKYWGMVGVFEGAGYCAQDMYRPMLDCLMFSKGAKPFCKVCEEHVVKVIKHYIE